MGDDNGSTPTVQFVKELPQRRHSEGKFTYFFDELRDNPEQWALWPGSNHGSVASSIRDNKYAGQDDDPFEVKVINKDVYVRYLPEDEDEDEELLGPSPDEVVGQAASA